MNYFSKIAVVILSALLIFSSSYDSSDLVNSENQSRSTEQSPLSLHQNKTFILGLQARNENSFKLINNFHLNISKTITEFDFNLQDYLDSVSKSFSSYFLLKTLNLYQILLNRKIIFPFHLFW